MWHTTCTCFINIYCSATAKTKKLCHHFINNTYKCAKYIQYISLPICCSLSFFLPLSLRPFHSHHGVHGGWFFSSPVVFGIIFHLNRAPTIAFGRRLPVFPFRFRSQQKKKTRTVRRYDDQYRGCAILGQCSNRP